MDVRTNGERWRRVEALYHAALSLPPSQRAEFLQRSCAQDPELRQEVEALLSVTNEAKDFLEPPPSSPDKGTRAARSWVGQDLGPYRVTAFIGAGGMGQVYQATDTRLNRHVAVKVLHEAFNSDADRLRRFEQEARATAALNHPNILAVFDVGARDGAPYYVSELLDGETLREMLRRRTPAFSEAVDYAIQIAIGLAAAHERGIIHRDVKPENVFVTRDGRVKLLDFGVAKLVESAPPPVTPTGATIRGTLVGTIGYISPEQLSGGPVDARTDIYSLGAVLYEMVTGHRAFDSETAVDTARPRQRDTRSAAPASGINSVLSIARRCLARTADGRFESCRELAAALSAVRAREDEGASRAWLRSPVVVAALLLVAAIATLAAWMSSRPRAGDVAQIRSVAVLPLTSLSRQPDDDLFADGMTGALITNLAKIRALRVVSRTSVMQYKNTQKSVPQIGRDLNVDAVVEGSIERVGSRVRISAQLIRTATDEHLWADVYDRDARDVLMLQNEVAQSVAREVQVTLTPEERAGFARARPVDPAAYELYLKARVAWNERTEGSIRRAIAYFTQAIERDPNYAAAHSGLADCYLSLGFSFDVGSVPPHEAIPKAKVAALKALELDNTLAAAHSSLAYAKLNYDWDWAGAEAGFRRALTLNPGSAEAHHWYSHFLVSSGRIEESLAESNQALALDQLNPIISVHLGWNQFFAREYDRAVTQLGSTIALDPNYGLAYWFRGLAYEQQHKFTDALAEMSKGAALLTGNVVVSADMGHVHAVAGNRRAAEAVIDELREESGRRYVSPFEIALIYVGIGDRDRAFEWLDKAYLDRSDLLVYLKVDPRLDPIRSDRRFGDLVARVGIP
jgi:serine/threonine-protein kinase